MQEQVTVLLAHSETLRFSASPYIFIFSFFFCLVYDLYGCQDPIQCQLSYLDSSPMSVHIHLEYGKEDSFACLDGWLSIHNYGMSSEGLCVLDARK